MAKANNKKSGRKMKALSKRKGGVKPTQKTADERPVEAGGDLDASDSPLSSLPSDVSSEHVGSEHDDSDTEGLMPYAHNAQRPSYPQTFPHSGIDPALLEPLSSDTFLEPLFSDTSEFENSPVDQALFAPFPNDSLFFDPPIDPALQGPPIVPATSSTFAPLGQTEFSFTSPTGAYPAAVPPETALTRRGSGRVASRGATASGTFVRPEVELVRLRRENEGLKVDWNESNIRCMFEKDALKTEVEKYKTNFQFIEDKLIAGEKQYSRSLQNEAILQTKVNDLQVFVSNAEGQYRLMEMEVQEKREAIEEADHIAATQKALLQFKDHEISERSKAAENATARAIKAEQAAAVLEPTLVMMKDYAPDIVTSTRRVAELEAELRTSNAKVQSLDAQLMRLQKDVNLARRRKQNKKPLPRQALKTVPESEAPVEEDSNNSLENQADSSILTGNTSEGAIPKPDNKPVDRVILKIPANKYTAKGPSKEQGTPSIKQVQKGAEHKPSNLRLSVSSEDIPADKSQQPEIAGKIEQVSKEAHDHALEAMNRLSGENKELTKKLADKGKAEGRLADLESEKAKLQELLNKKSGKGKKTSSSDNGGLETLLRENSHFQQQLKSCENEKAENAKTIVADLQRLDSLQKEVESLKRQLAESENAKVLENIKGLCRKYQQQLEESNGQVQKLEEEKVKEASNRSLVIETFKRTNMRLQQQYDDEVSRNASTGNEERVQKLHATIASLRREKAELAELSGSAEGDKMDVTTTVSENPEKDELIKKLREERDQLQEQLKSGGAQVTTTVSEEDELIKNPWEEKDQLQEQSKSGGAQATTTESEKAELIKKLREEHNLLQAQFTSLESRDAQATISESGNDELVKKLQEENDLLQAQLTPLPGEARVTTTDSEKDRAIKKLQEENYLLQEQLESGGSGKSDVAKIISERDAAIKEKDDAVHEKVTAQKLKGQAVVDKDDAIKERDEARKEAEEHADEVMQMDEDFKKKTATINLQKDSIKQKDEAIREYEEDIKKKDEAIREGMEDIKKKDQVIEAKDKNISKLKETRALLQRQLEKANGDVQKHKTILENNELYRKVRGERDELVMDHKSCKRVKTELEKLVSERDRAISKLKEDHKAELEKQLHALPEREQALERAKEDFDHFRLTRDRKLDKENSEHLDHIRRLQRKEADLSKMLQSYQEGKSEAEAASTEKDQTIDRLRQEKEVLQAERQQLQTEKEELQAQMDKKVAILQQDLGEKVKDNEETSKLTPDGEARTEKLLREKAKLEEELRTLEENAEESDTDADEPYHDSEEWTPEVAAREIARNRKAARREKRMQDPAAYAHIHAATGGCHPEDSDYDTDIDSPKLKQANGEDPVSDDDHDSLFDEPEIDVKEKIEQGDKGEDSQAGMYDDRPRNLSISSVVTKFDEPPKAAQIVELTPEAGHLTNAETKTNGPTDDDSHLINPQRTLTDVRNLSISPVVTKFDEPPKAAQNSEVTKDTVVEVAQNIDFIGEKIVIKEKIIEKMIYCPFRWWLRPYQDLLLFISLVSLAALPFGSLLFQFGKLHGTSWNLVPRILGIHTDCFSEADSNHPPSAGPSQPLSEGGDDQPGDVPPNDNDATDSDKDGNVDTYVPKIATRGLDGEYDTLMTMEPPWAPGMAEIYRRRPSLLDDMTFEPVPPMPRGWTRKKFLAGIDQFSDNEETADDEETANAEDLFADIYDEEPAAASGPEPSSEPEEEVVPAPPSGPTLPPIKNVLLLLIFHAIVYALIIFFALEFFRTRHERSLWLSSNELTRQTLIGLRGRLFRDLRVRSESAFWTYFWGKTPQIAKEVAFTLDKAAQIERRMMG